MIRPYQLALPFPDIYHTTHSVNAQFTIISMYFIKSFWTFDWLLQKPTQKFIFKGLVKSKSATTAFRIYSAKLSSKETTLNC